MKHTVNCQACDRPRVMSMATLSEIETRNLAGMDCSFRCPGCGEFIDFEAKEPNAEAISRRRLLRTLREKERVRVVLGHI